MRLEWSAPAADELERAHSYYAELNPVAARLLAQRIVAAADRLRRTPLIGRPGLRLGTREWVVSRTPYLLVYRVKDDLIEVLHVWHGAQDWLAHDQGS